MLSQILKQWGKTFSKENIYVAVHALSDYAKGKDVDGFKNEFKDRVNYICDFHHTNDALYTQFCGKDGALIKFLDAVKKNGKKTVRAYCEEIIELIRKMSEERVKKRTLGFLKHNIDHIYGELFLDIQLLLQDIPKKKKKLSKKSIRELRRIKNGLEEKKKNFNKHLEIMKAFIEDKYKDDKEKKEIILKEINNFKEWFNKSFDGKYKEVFDAFSNREKFLKYLEKDPECKNFFEWHKELDERLEYIVVKEKQIGG